MSSDDRPVGRVRHTPPRLTSDLEPDPAETAGQMALAAMLILLMGALVIAGAAWFVYSEITQ